MSRTIEDAWYLGGHKIEWNMDYHENAYLEYGHNEYIIDDVFFVYESWDVKYVLSKYKGEAEHVVVPDIITVIDGDAFSGNANLKSVVFPESCRKFYDEEWHDEGPVKITGSLFSGCRSLREVNLPNNMDIIPDRMFAGCISLETIRIPDSVTAVGEYAFICCEQLTDVRLPDGVMKIGGYAFSECLNLEYIDLPGSLTEIGDFCFTFSGLKSISIPDSVQPVGEYQFRDCYSLKEVKLLKGFSKITGSMFSTCYSIQQVELPDTVAEIGEYAFFCCDDLEEINIPDSVVIIGNKAFHGCDKLPAPTKARIRGINPEAMQE
jgi:hypothetical protein